jgi:tetratricopeptide (TPR) repeat protein
MLKKLPAIAMLLGLLGVTPSLVNAAPPVQKTPAPVCPKEHAILCRAQKETEAALKSATAAQKAGEFDQQGNAQEAKGHLDQAYKELKEVLGAIYAVPSVQKKPEQHCPQGHDALCRAKDQTEAALKTITAAQKANEFDQQGHAQKAKDYLDQAYKELSGAVDIIFTTWPEVKK